jgi:type IX secretion system substrate protein
MKKIYFLLLALCLFTGASAQIINFPDANFKARLLAASPTNTIAKNLAGAYFKIDADNDGEIQLVEANNVLSLEFGGNYNIESIQDITGIASFGNLKKIYIYSRLVGTVDFTQNHNIEEIYVSGNSETINLINLSGLTNLVNLDLFSIRPHTFPYNYDKVNVALTGCTNLIDLNIYNSCVNINYCEIPNLKYLNCSYLEGGESEIFDFSCLNRLETLDISENVINKLILKNGSVLTSLNLGLNDAQGIGAMYICIDDNEFELAQVLAQLESGFTANISTYCSFTPGGTFYTIQGSNKYDSNNNGCDVSDNALSNLKFTITDGTNSGNIISNTSGNYSISVGAGTHTITPNLENPNYFNVSPAAVNVTFPTQTSPFTQNFCVTANGVHPDLEVVIVPLTPSRPGFDATYKLVYKNKGNQMQSGSVNLTFNDAVLDFVLATPVTTNQTVNNLSWDFANLLPFETREILVTLNLNSPMESPAVNSGDVLNYTATISSAVTDDLPNDNVFAFNQTVVNSFDPNDKTCLEGATIAPSEVGKYVHYMIRFENTGTFPAENIVVKDIIDTNKFDINSLVPMKGSHSFVTNITSGNKVEFIFENINLPFDDANNDGYVAFKIKTKPTLVVGNTFSNSANIYFDYNSPIVTNTATTTVATLSNQDFGFESYFMLYPNPVNDVLNIETKQTIEVTSISIYNQLGQLVLVVPNAQDMKSVDVSSLSAGNYFIKVNSDKGTSNTKFIKK